jgi:O-antigen/teichoic acid export membrane protein
VLVFSDRFFLRHFGSLEQVGIYALGYKFAAVLAMFVSGPFALAWQSNQFEIAKDENARKVFAKALTLQFSVAMFVALGIALFSRDAIRILAPAQYGAAHLFVPVLVLSYVVADLRQIVMSGLHVTSNTKRIAAMAAAVAVLNLALNYMMIPRWQAWGAAWATLISYLIHLVLVWQQGQRIYHVRYEYLRISIIAASWVGLVLVQTAAPALPLYYSLPFSALLVLVFVGCIWMTLDMSERQRASQILVAALAKVGITRGRDAALAIEAGGAPRD